MSRSGSTTGVTSMPMGKFANIIKTRSTAARRVKRMFHLRKSTRYNKTHLEDDN
jgi:hypothetical protein